MGPQAIRYNSVNCRAYNPELDVAPFDYLSGIDYGDVPMMPGYLEECFENTEKVVGEIVRSDVMPIALGGDHSITYPMLRAIASKYGKVSVLHFDAHYDNCTNYFGKKHNHATWVYHGVKEGLIDAETSIQIGMRGSGFASDRQRSTGLGLETITCVEMMEMGIKEVGKRIRDRIGNNLTYASFDIDFVDPATAPGTGTIEPGGPNGYQTLSLVRECKNIKLVGMDMVEMLPSLDVSGITANLAANTIYEFISMKAYQIKKRI